MINTIAEFAERHGCRNAYEFMKRSQISQPTAYRLWNNPQAYPSRDVQEMICKTFDAQPGDFLRYVPEDNADA